MYKKKSPLSLKRETIKHLGSLSSVLGNAFTTASDISRTCKSQDYTACDISECRTCPIVPSGTTNGGTVMP